MPLPTSLLVRSAESLRLELEFRFFPNGGLTPQTIKDLEGKGLAGEVDTGEADAGGSVADCLDLVQSVNGYLAFIEASIPAGRHLGKLRDYACSDHARNALREGRARSRVRTLHYGSPFLFDIDLPTLSPAGLAFLFYAAKRLYGAKLEFREYREKRHQRFIEAERARIQLERRPLPEENALSEVGPLFRWTVERAVVTDESD